MIHPDPIPSSGDFLVHEPPRGYHSNNIAWKIHRFPLSNNTALNLYIRIYYLRVGKVCFMHFPEFILIILYIYNSANICRDPSLANHVLKVSSSNSPMRFFGVV